jgi:hypothetical protein
MIIDSPVLHVQTELRSDLKSHTVPYEDEDTAAFKLSQFRLDWRQSADYYLTLNGLAMEGARSALPALRKYEDRRLVQRAGILLQYDALRFNIGRDDIQQGNIFLEDPHNPWLPPYFRYFAPFSTTASQLGITWQGWGLWHLQLTNDVTTEEEGRGQFNGSHRQPAWLGHVTARAGRMEISAGLGEYDMRNSQWYELRLSTRMDRFAIKLNAIRNNFRLKIGSNEANDRLGQSVARFVVWNAVIKWTPAPDLGMHLQASQVNLRNSGRTTEIPVRAHPSWDGSLRIFHSLPHPNWEIGLALQQRSSLLPKDLPQSYEDHEGRAFVLDVHVDLVRDSGSSSVSTSGNCLPCCLYQ